MQILRNGYIKERTVVALGNFDGLHNAHISVIDNAVKCAKRNRCKSCVLLFANHTRNVTDGNKTKILTDEAEKLDLLCKMGVDIAYIHEFDDAFMHLSPREFSDFLKDTLNPISVSVGYDYRFGFKAQGDTALLCELGKEFGFDVLIKDKVEYEHCAIKSTRIRECIANGEMELANALLGRPYSVMGEVVKGFQNGRKLGFPTANVKYSNNKLLPEVGVYMGYTTIDGKRYRSVINVGNNPTFDADNITVESHILDFDGDIYGQTVVVEFLKYIRGEKKFKDVSDLVKQIKKDVEVVVASAKGE